MSHAMQDHPRQKAHSEECWRGLLEEEMANHSSILDVRIPRKVCKGKKMWHQKFSPQFERYPIGYWGRAISSSSRKNEADRPKQKWPSVMDVSAGESKVWSCNKHIAEEPGMLGPCVCVCVLVSQLCLTLCYPMNCSRPGPSVHGILQARVLECVTIPFSREFSWPRDQT